MSEDAMLLTSSGFHDPSDVQLRGPGEEMFQRPLSRFGFLPENGLFRVRMLDLLEEHDLWEERCAFLERKLQESQAHLPEPGSGRKVRPQPDLTEQSRKQEGIEAEAAEDLACQKQQPGPGTTILSQQTLQQQLHQRRSTRRETPLFTFPSLTGNSEGGANSCGGNSDGPVRVSVRPSGRASILKQTTDEDVLGITDTDYLSERTKSRVSIQQLEEAALRLRSCFRYPPASGDVRPSQTTIKLKPSGQRPEKTRELELAGQSLKCQALDPNSLPRLIVDMCLLFVCIHDTAYVPVNLAWSLPPSGYSRIAEAISLSLWICDIGMNFFTGYVKDGIIVRDLRRIAIRYLTTLFPFDFLVTSIDLISVCMDNMVQDDTLSKSGKVLRVLKLNKLARATIIFQRSAAKSKFTSNSWTLLGLGGRLVAIVLCLNHLICCMWFWLGDLSADSSWSDTGSSWLHIGIAGGEIMYQDASLEFQYLTSLHWALTQMTPGSMAVTPQNSLERTWNIVCLLMGMFISSLLISQLSAKMVRVQTMNHEKLTQMELLHRFLLEQSVPRSLAARIQRQVQERASISKPLTFQELPPLAHLPTTLRHELTEEVFAPWILRHTIFFSWCTWDDSMVLALATRVAALEAYSPDDEVFSHTQEATKTIIVQAGVGHYELKMKITDAADDSLAISRDWGEATEVVVGQFLSCIALWCHWSYVGSLSAGKHALQVISLSAEPLLEILRRKPEILEQSYKYGLAYSLLASTPENHRSLDLEITAPHVLMAMSLADRSTFSKVFLDCLETAPEISADVHRYAPVRSKVTARQLELMKEELEAGKCVVTLGTDGELLRTVLLCVLKIKTSSGMLLVHLGTYRHGDVKIVAKLPGTKLCEGESAEDAAKRVMWTELPCLGGKLDIISQSEEEQFKRSNQYGLRTAYLKTTFRVLLEESPDQPVRRSEMGTNLSGGSLSTNQALFSRAVSVQTRQLPILDTVERALGEGDFELYAWMKPSDFAVVSSPHVEHDLRAWIRNYHNNREVGVARVSIASTNRSVPMSGSSVTDSRGLVADKAAAEDSTLSAEVVVIPSRNSPPLPPPSRLPEGSFLASPFFL